MILNYTKNIFVRACVIFSFICAGYALVVMLANSEDDQVLLDASRILLFFVASLIFGLANFLRRSEKLGKITRGILHFVLYLFSFATCFMLPISPEPSTMIVAVVLFSVCYARVMSVCLLFGTLAKKKKKTSAD